MKPVISSALESRAKPRFRVQEAILILRQGKSHPCWREAAWHLMEHAGKDTQLLLEAQRDLIEGNQPDITRPWLKYGLFAGVALLVLGLLAATAWKAMEQVSLLC